MSPIPSLRTAWRPSPTVGDSLMVMVAVVTTVAPGETETWEAPGMVVFVEVRLLPDAPGVSGPSVMTAPDTVQGARNAVDPTTAGEALMTCAKSEAVWFTLPLSAVVSVYETVIGPAIPLLKTAWSVSPGVGDPPMVIVPVAASKDGFNRVESKDWAPPGALSCSSIVCVTSLFRGELVELWALAAIAGTTALSSRSPAVGVTDVPVGTEAAGVVPCWPRATVQTALPEPPTAVTSKISEPM